MITLEDYCTRKGQDLRQCYAGEWTDEHARNAQQLLNRVTILLHVFEHKHPEARRRTCNSGWRPAEVNVEIGGAPNSHHLTGRAIDVWDADLKLKAWLRTPLGEKFLVIQELWCEDFEVTRTWVHFQSVPPPSGARVFKVR